MSKQNLGIVVISLISLLATASYMLLGFEITALGLLIALVVVL